MGKTSVWSFGTGDLIKIFWEIWWHFYRAEMCVCHVPRPPKCHKAKEEGRREGEYSHQRESTEFKKGKGGEEGGTAPFLGTNVEFYLGQSRCQIWLQTCQIWNFFEAFLLSIYHVKIGESGLTP
jgi:hypothetical protein